MKTSDMRAKARAIFGPAIAEPMPKQPNGAKALQQRANARPIPTYKVGGVVKKPMPAASAASGNRMAKQEADEMRFMDMMDKKKKSAMPSPAASAASGNRMAREEGAEMRKMKMAKGGKAGKYADGGAPAAQPMGQVTAAYGANLRDQVKAGTMTNAQAQAAQNAFVKEQMAARTAADAKASMAKPMGQVTADFGAGLRNQINTGKMTTAQAQATQNNFVRDQMAMRTAADAKATAAQPMGQVTAAYGANLRDQIKAGKMTVAQAQAAQNAFVKQQMAARAQPIKRAKGGKAGKYADGGMAEELLVEGRRPQTIDFDMNRMQGTTGSRMGPPPPSSGGGGGRGAAPMMEEPAPPPRSGIRLGTTNRFTGATADVGKGRATFGIGPSVGGSRRVGIGYLRPFKDGGKVQTSSDTARKLASEMGGMKKGGKVKPVELDMKMLEEASRPRASLPNLESKVAEARNLNTVRAKETSDATKKQSFKEAFAEARRDQGANGVFTWRGNHYNTKMAGETSKAAPAPTRAAAPAAAPASRPAAAPASRPAAPAAAAPASRPAATPPAAPTNKSGNASTSMSSVIRNLDSGFDLDALAKKKMAESKDSFFSSPMNIEQAREAVRAEAEMQRRRSANRAQVEKSKASLAAGRKANPDLVSRFVDMTMNPGYKKGGKVKEPKPKNGLAVMIAIGKPMKPAKKMNGGPMAERSTDMESSKVTRNMAMGGDPMGYAAGGAGKTRKGQAPIKKAQGGAAKVRKGMMTPEGDIINVMNKMRGK